MKDIDLESQKKFRLAIYNGFTSGFLAGLGIGLAFIAFVGGLALALDAYL